MAGRLSDGSMEDGSVWASWVHIPPLRLDSCVSLGKLLNFSEPLLANYFCCENDEY